MSGIVTFYSFKGGVGRSMALANIAVLLAGRGQRVLCVDWDLEAPGLERYFDYFDVTPTRGGLLPFLVEQDARLVAKEEVNPGRYREHLWTVKIENAQPISLFTSGRLTHLDYVGMLERFQWTTFFSRGGGDFLERLRELWREHFDIVLVDSRTGMGDMGGICTIQIPDVLVVLFTANHQSVQGVRDVIEWAQAGRQRLAYDRMPLTILPIPSRFSMGGDFKIASEWLDRFAQMVGACFGDWLPRWVSPRAALERLKIPHHDAFAFGERLAVVEQGVNDPAGLGHAYDRITDLLASDFRDVEAGLGSIARTPPEYRQAIPHQPVRPQFKHPLPDDGYRYDIFVSYVRSGGVLEEAINRFLQEVTKQLENRIGRTLRVFRAEEDLRSGESISKTVESALEQSRMLLVLLTPQYFSSAECMHEWQTFEARVLSADQATILPIVLRPLESVPERFHGYKMLNASESFARPVSRSIDFAKLMDVAASEIEHLMRQAPSRRTAQLARGDVVEASATLTVEVGASTAAQVTRRDVPIPPAPRQTAILFIAANPVGTSQLALDVEAREFERVIRFAPYRDSFALHTRWAASPSDLLEALNMLAPSIVHFSGHGSNDGLFFVADDGLPFLVSADQLAMIFCSAGTSVRLAVLNASSSKNHIAKLVDCVDCVIGMGVVTDEESRRFAVGLYRGLAHGRSVESAYTMAVAEVSLLGRINDSRPTLEYRKGVNPAELYFVAPADRFRHS